MAFEPSLAYLGRFWLDRTDPGGRGVTCTRVGFFHGPTPDQMEERGKAAGTISGPANSTGSGFRSRKYRQYKTICGKKLARSSPKRKACSDHREQRPDSTCYAMTRPAARISDSRSRRKKKGKIKSGGAGRRSHESSRSTSR